MSGSRPLRGGCQCGRNRYIVMLPQEGVQSARVVFNTERHHQTPLATPLAAYIRVPLSWYHSTTYAFFPDETHAMIRRAYTHPTQGYAKRHFCGFCGTPLSYWSEEPRSEAEFISLTMGSLLREDLQDLEDMGLLPEEPQQQQEHQEHQGQQGQQWQEEGEQKEEVRTRLLFGVPWLEGLVEGTRLGNMRLGNMRGEVGWDVVDVDMFEEEEGNGATAKRKHREDE